MSRRTTKRNRNTAKPVLESRGTLALVERHQPDPESELTLEENLRLLEAGSKASRRLKGGSGASRSFSLAWDETEAMGITADMRRSGPGMLSDQDRKETLYQAYLNSVWISACVDVIAKRITSGGMVIELTEKGVENQAEYDQLHEFLHYINEDEDFLQLIRSIATDILIYGEAYMEIVRKNGVPFSLHKIDCTTMNYKLDKHGNVVQYTQNMNHSTETVTFEPDDVIRWWLPDPKAGKKALSPIERILGSIDADAHMADWVRAFFRKGARPPFWIKFPGSKEEASRFVTWLRENYTGQANAHIPMVLYDDAELHEIGKGAVDMDFAKGRGMMRQEILAGYQVPPAIVSQIESGNIGGGTGESQDKSFQYNACDPVRHLIFEKFNYRVVQKGFGITNWRVNTRYSDYRSDMDVVKIYDTQIRNGSLNVNEVRSELGKKPVEGGDENVIVTTKEVQPVCRLMELADEQRQQTQTAIQQAQAQLEMTKVQVDKAKNPPAPPPIPNTPQQQEQPSESPPHAKQGNAKQNTKDEGNQEGKEAQERYVCDLQNAVSHVTEILTRADEHLRMIRMQEAGIPQPVQVVIQTNETSRIDAPHNDTNEPTEPSQPIANDVLSEGNRDRPAMLQQHTGMMVAFMLDPDVASQLALPGGEDPADLHVTLAFLGDMGDTMPEGKLHPVQTLDNLKDVLSGFAERMQPLSGKPGGIGRFINAHTDVTPVIAHVNAPGLQDWRRQLVETLEAASYRVHDDFDYLPHLTLAYIPDDAPMPVDTIPTDVYFSFDTLCLTIGDDRYYFKIGGNDSGDGMHVESTIEETKKPAIAARNEWCPPSSTQLALEKDLAKAIKSYISKAKATKDGVTLPDETAHDHLHEALLDALSKAVNEGRHIALGTHEESMVSAAKNLAGRAVEVISDIVTQIKAKAKDLIDSIFGDDDVNPDDAQQVLDDQIEQWADEYSDMVAQTEVHAAVEGAVLDEMQQAGVGKMRWLAEPDACEMCRELAESGAIDTTDEWSGGITSPPAHPNCKCQVGMVEEN